MKGSEGSLASLSGPMILPTEILSKIFLQVTDIDGTLTPNNTTNMPLLLTKICRSWRTIAIGTKPLWSRLHLSIKPNAIHQTALVSTWLSRSGSCPLHIYIMWVNPPFFSSHPVLDILIQHSNRWRNMYFFLPIPAYSSFAPIRGNLPILTELSLGTHEPLTRDRVLDAFEVAPRLKSLECVNLHPFMFNFPWAHLSHIPIMVVTMEESLDILRRALKLKNASFICTDEDEGLPIPIPTPLRHENLRELAILAPLWSEIIETSAVFRSLTAPHLKSLRICNVTKPFGTHLITFLARVDDLESLYLRKTALSERDIIAALEVVPSLKHLTLISSTQFTMATDTLLERLTWRPTTSSSSKKKLLNPKLETLEITLPDSLSTPFVELLESRWSPNTSATKVSDSGSNGPVARLRRVEVGASDECDEDIMARLENLAQAGMTVVIGSSDVPLEDGLEYMSTRFRGEDDTLL